MAGWTRPSAWVAVGVLAAALALTPALSGHAAAGPDAAVGTVVGVVHCSAAAVGFGGLVLVGTWVLPGPERGAAAGGAPLLLGGVHGHGGDGGERHGAELAAAGKPPALGATAYGQLLVAKVVVFVLLITVAGRSRVLVRRRLTARPWSALQLHTDRQPTLHLIT